MVSHLTSSMDIVVVVVETMFPVASEEGSKCSLKDIISKVHGLKAHGISY